MKIGYTVCIQGWIDVDKRRLLYLSDSSAERGEIQLCTHEAAAVRSCHQAIHLDAD